MKQILLQFKSGNIELADVPSPTVDRGMVLIQTSRSLISPGTERMLVEFGKSNLLKKAQSQPEKVKQVLDKLKTDGIIPTMEAVFRKLDEPMPLGYCNVGRVIAVGPGITDLAPGDCVVSNGSHAEIVCVPRNLVAKVPEGIADDTAVFTVPGSIALQGLRLAEPTFGERFMVFGTGLIGLLTIQLLHANGCSVIAVDTNPERLALAASFGSRTVDISSGGDPAKDAGAWTNGAGVDGVIITASAKTDEIVHQAAGVCRKRGRIVLVGVTGLNLRRDDFYKKELSFQVSCSYGPGRYDDEYEQNGLDYPLPFVRWTEQRNFEAVLGAMKNGSLDVAPLITHRVPFDRAVEAYGKILDDSSALGVLLEYPESVNRDQYIQMGPWDEKTDDSGGAQPSAKTAGTVSVGVIGAGNYAKAVLLPALANTRARIACVADSDPAAARKAARKFKADTASTDYRQILDNPEIAAVFILVRHNLHARFVIEALEAGKHVFVEKPLCISNDELQEIRERYLGIEPSVRPTLMVGFNRRFSPHAARMKELLKGHSEPLTMTMTVNAGAIPADHWVQNTNVGGGRIVGEGCHFIDVMSFLADSPVTGVTARMVGDGTSVREDKMSILMEFSDGSLGTVHYFSNGSKQYPKETLEVFSDGRVLRMENFRKTEGYGFNSFKKLKTWRQDKGHNAEIRAFVELLENGGAPLISPEEIFNVTRASLASMESARTKKPIRLDE